MAHVWFMRTSALVLLALSGCLTESTHNGQDCGRLPDPPDWEYTEHAGAPAEIHMPLNMWLADLDWRSKVLVWGACMSARHE